MANFFLLCNPPFHPHSFASHAPPTSFGVQPFPVSTALRFAGSDNSFRRKTRGSMVATRAGPSTSSYVFAFALPFSLLAITVFTSLRIADKLDQDFLEEMAKNEAFMEVEEDEDGDDDDDVDVDDAETYLQEEPTLPRARNRPKREA